MVAAGGVARKLIKRISGGAAFHENTIWGNEGSLLQQILGIVCACAAERHVAACLGPELQLVVGSVESVYEHAAKREIGPVQNRKRFRMGAVRLHDKRQLEFLRDCHLAQERVLLRV